MSIYSKIKDRFTKCDSGESLNWLMHPFLFITFSLGIGFTFFSHTETVSSTLLYQEVQGDSIMGYSIWGLIALVVSLLNIIAFWIRGKTGASMMTVVYTGGFYIWLWATVSYILAGLLYHSIFFCFPNLYFWSWYVIQWRRRIRGERVAFV